MARIAVIDGVASPLDEARVSVRDRGFLYGDSVFETLRTYGGRPFALSEHLERLSRSAALVFIDEPISREELAHEVHDAIALAGNAESYVRIMLTRGAGELGLDPGNAERPLRVILVTELHPPPASTYERGISAVTYRVHRALDGLAASSAKIGNYLASVIAVRAARAAGAAEALIVDGEDRVIEGATSNVFFVEGGRLVTPPLEAGILPGITREKLLEVARRLGISVQLSSPHRRELNGFEEVFVSSSIRELVAVVEIDGSTVSGGAPGPVYRRLLEAFRAEVRGSAAP